MYNTEVRLVLYEVQVEVHELILVLIVSNREIMVISPVSSLHRVSERKLVDY